VSEQRLVLVNRIELCGEPVARVCRELKVSRKTAYKWLERYRQSPAEPLVDRSRRPRSAPRQTIVQVEANILAQRDCHGWGARKLRAMLQPEQPLPSLRTVHRILKRNGRVEAATPSLPPLERFERPAPNQLWQLDHKSPVEIGRQKRHPLTVLDDHSRYLLRVEPCVDLGYDSTWAVLWEVFGEAGLPDALLCDGAYTTRNSVLRTLTRFESMLIRLGIRPVHGRSYHPQTQGKVERLHGTFEREMYPKVRFDSDENFRADTYAWRSVYNCIRPHEALDDRPPATRWRPSERKRPDQLPEVEYLPGAMVRLCDLGGNVSYKQNTIMVGEGLVGQHVRIVEDDRWLRVFYATHEIRVIPLELLTGKKTPRI
jgi:transposase InsO family protein